MLNIQVTANLERTMQLALEAAVYTVIRRIDPDITIHVANKRSSINVVQNFGEYTVELDGESIIKVSELEVNSFKMEIL